MKKTISTITLGLLTSLSSFATVFTVNNSTVTPGSPGQYTTIQDAFSAASFGDTILVSGSPNPYSGSLSINKRICILGPGYKPQTNNKLKADLGGSTFTFASVTAGGSVIMGLYNASINVNNLVRLPNVVIRRNFLQYIYLPDSTHNWLIAENIINRTISSTFSNLYSRHTGLRILNNIFLNAGFHTYAFTGFKNYYPFEVKNNLFLGGSYGTQLSSSPSGVFGTNSGVSYQITNGIINNNIFYNSVVSASSQTPPTSCAFTNNISFSGVTNPLFTSYTGNSSTGNLDNSDPLYANLFTNLDVNKILPGIFDLFNIRISNSSPAKNAGTDGTDIGPTGGAYPIYNNVLANEQLSGEPPLPQVRNANFTNNVNAVQTGGSLQINVTGRKRN